MKSTLAAFVMMGLTSSGCAAKTLTPTESLFTKPLIVGASVSDDTGTWSPAKRLGMRYSPKKDIRVIARGGTPGRNLISSIGARDIADRSIVVGVDFLFWDSTLPAPGTASIDAMQTLIDHAASKKVPLVIGDIPPLLGGSAQASRTELNTEIHKRCVAARGCHVLALDALYQQILRDGYLKIKGRNYTLKQIVPDGLHLSGVASTEIADRMFAMLEAAQASRQTGKLASRR